MCPKIYKLIHQAKVVLNVTYYSKNTQAKVVLNLTYYSKKI